LCFSTTQKLLPMSYLPKITGNSLYKVTHNFLTKSYRQRFGRAPQGQFLHRINILCGMLSSCIETKSSTIEGLSNYSIVRHCKDDETIVKSDMACCYYKKRFKIELLFKQMKSAGFNVHKSKIEGAHRVANLIIVVALAFLITFCVGLYLIAQPDEVLKKFNLMFNFIPIICHFSNLPTCKKRIINIITICINPITIIF
jgi:hypothetical protein